MANSTKDPLAAEKRNTYLVNGGGRITHRRASVWPMV